MIPTLLRRCLAAAVALAPAFSHGGLVHAVNSGGGGASPFAADAFFSGGITYSSGAAINTSGVTDPAPQAVYQTERFGNFTYTFTGLAPNAAHTVRLHLAETFHSTAGSRRFHVSINGTQVLTNYDIFAEAGGKNIAIVEEFPATANPFGQIVVQFANGAADNAKSSGIEILDQVVAGGAPIRIQVDFGNGAAYSGMAVAPGTGTVWNNFTAQTTASHTLSNLSDASGAATACDVTVASSSAPMKSWTQTSLGNPNPSGLMSDYFFGNTYTVTVSELPAGNYYLYVYAHGDQANQNSTVTVSAANGGGSATTAATGTEYRNIHTAGALGYSYLRFQPVVGAAGTLTFSAASYLNGFQLISFPTPVFTLQPPPSPSAVIGSDFNLTAAATGDGTLTYQWRKGGLNLADGPTYAGVTTPTLTIANVQAADAGNYDLVVTNPGGSIASNVATLTTTTTPLAPEIVAGPFNQSVQATQTATFTTVVNGTAPLGFAWTKNGSPVSDGPTAHGSMISGADTSTLIIANAKLADAGTYEVTVTNPVGSDSDTATLVVNQAPVILGQPQSATVNSGVWHTLSATFGEAFPAPVHQWSRSADGLTFTNVSGGNGPSLELTASAATSGFYRVTATNSAGSVTSSVVYFGIPSAQVATFAPANNATEISIDQQLRLVFPSPPKLGLSGALRIHDASNNAVVATVGRSQFTGYTLFSGTVINAAKQSVQGKQMFYLPIAIYGNEVWVTLGVNQRLSYGRAYYVTMDAGLLVDSNNAAWPGISGSNAWRFSTKAAGPETPTATTGAREITVGMDGTGDFATIQGAADWIPQDNTLPRTIRVKPGVYRDIAYFGQNRDFISLVGDGADREDVRLIHLYAAEVYGDGARGMGALRIDTDDVTVRDLTIDNEVYVAQPNLAGGFAPGAPAFAGPINTVATTGKRLVFDNVLIKGGQDTLYTITGIVYFHRCEIWGSVDFIYGEALGVFDDCDIVQIRSTGGPIGAPSTPFAQPYGEVFLNCRFPRALAANGYPYDVGTNTTTFMRPWRQDGATAIINCQLGTHITTKGWSEWGGREVTCRAREHGNTIIGGGAAPTPAQRQAAGAYWTNTIDPDYTGPPMTETNAAVAPSTGTGNRQPVTVDPADYTLAAIFGHPYFNLGGWMPSLAPRFTVQPGSQAAAAGSSVTLTAAATGKPAPTYQWRKDGVDLQDGPTGHGSTFSGTTGPTLTIGNAQPADAGDYTVVVTSQGVSVTSTISALTVSPTGTPQFQVHPASQTIPVGQALTLGTMVTGQAPLSYQWQKSEDNGINFNNLGGATSASYALPIGKMSAGGQYRLVATNGLGSAASSPAIISVNPSYAPLSPDGFASSVTGGGNLTPVVVTTAAAFKSLAESTPPAVITISGNLILTSSVKVKSNKTIQGIDADATILGTLSLSGVNNVIIRGLNLTNPETTLGPDGKYTDGGDGMSIDGSTRIFITHCTAFDCADGLIDTRLGSTDVTVSWSKFYYSSASLAHRFAMIADGGLIRDPVTDEVIAGGTPLRMTMHHNWWAENCDQRQPSSTHGRIHLFNNYWNTPGNSYAALARSGAQFLSENNRSLNVKSPLSKSFTNALLPDPLIRAIGNSYSGSTGTTDPGTDVVFTPSYSYPLCPAANVAAAVTAKAGNIAGAASSTSPTVVSASITGPAVVGPGGNATLAVAPAGFTPLSHQWRFQNFDIVGATSPTLQVTNAQAANAGSYSVVLGHAGGETVVSSGHVLEVVEGAPVITLQPVSQSVAVRAPVTFTVSTSADPAPVHQWYQNGIPIDGANGPSLVIPEAAGADLGDYTVVVSNPISSATSQVARLTFSDPLANYVLAHGLDPAVEGAPLADPDHDGVVNRIEFFLGGDPSKADVPTSTLSAKPGTTGAPAVIFEFDRLKAAAAMPYVVEHASTLGGEWTPAAHGVNGASIIVSPLNDEFDRITVSIPTAEPAAFVRLRL